MSLGDAVQRCLCPCALWRLGAGAAGGQLAILLARGLGVGELSLALAGRNSSATF